MGREIPSQQPRPRWGQAAAGRLISLSEAAQALGISAASVRRLVQQGRLCPVRITRRIQFDVRDVDGLIERSKGPRSL